MNIICYLCCLVMHFYCNTFSKMIKTGIKRAKTSVSYHHRLIRSHLRMTQSRAGTPARAFAMGDQSIQKSVTPTKPRTSVSIPQSPVFTLQISDPLFFHLLFACVFFYVICSFKEEDPSFHLWLYFLWYNSRFPWMHCPASLSQTRFGNVKCKIS